MWQTVHASCIFVDDTLIDHRFDNEKCEIRIVNQKIMESSPGLVRRRIQEMTTSFQTQNSPKSSPKNSPKNLNRKKIQPVQQHMQPSIAKLNSSKMSSSSLSNKHFNSMGAKPYKPMYTATATATITISKSPATNRRFNHHKSVNDDSNDTKKGSKNEGMMSNLEMKHKRVFPPVNHKEEDIKDREKSLLNADENNESVKSSSLNNGFKQRRKATPTNLLLTAPKPFKSLTNTYDSHHRKPMKNVQNNVNMDCTDGSSQTLYKSSLSSSTLPSSLKHQQHSNGFGRLGDQTEDSSKDLMSSQSQDLSSPTSEPPPILPRRSASSLQSPNKPAVPPKPKNISNKTPSPKKSSPELNGKSSSSNLKCNINGDNTSKMQFKKNLQSAFSNGKSKSLDTDIGVEQDVDTDRFCESPINTSFTKFNQRVQKLDLLKRRQSYSEFEELIEKKRELRERMLAKISLLREEHDVLLNEKKENDKSGKRVLVRLEQMATGKEVDKYRQFLEEIEHITKLTVGLTIRLSRLTKKIENGRSQLSDDMLSQEKKKRKRLVDQTEEAEFLHRNTDRRSGQVRKMLSRYLDESDLNDYDAFLSNLVKHITDLKETEQRIQLGEEQLVALNDNLQTTTSPLSSPPIKTVK